MAEFVSGIIPFIIPGLLLLSFLINSDAKPPKIGGGSITKESSATSDNSASKEPSDLSGV